MESESRLTGRDIAEGVGPSEKLDLDLSGGHGNPHLGPHILAGVNGSGKSTILRTIAWVMDWPNWGFNHEQWRHFLSGRGESRALLVLKASHATPLVHACGEGSRHLQNWVEVTALPTEVQPDAMVRQRRGGVDWLWWVPRDSVFAEKRRTGVAAYAPSRSLRHLDRPHRMDALADPFKNCLAFESTVDNESIQAWLLSLHTRRAIAKERGKSTESYERSLSRFEAALKLVCGEDVHSEVEIDPTLQPRLRVFGQSLNFSQLPDGIRNTVGWLADYMMRQDLMQWDAALNGKQPGILLLDEVDAHLHPRWQRTLLPAMRKALPDVQILVTSHSPFVISSCPGSRVHVLELDKQGRAHAEPPEDAPFGESVMATLKDIFGVSSRFDIRTAEDLAEWNNLKKKEVTGILSFEEQGRLDKLTTELSDRSEELRSIVGSPPTLPDVLVQTLVRRSKTSPLSRRPDGRSPRKRQPMAG